MTRSIPISLAAYNDAMVEAIAGAVRPWVRTGDEVDLVSGNHDNPLSLANLGRWCERLVPQLPTGTLFAAHTSGLDNAATLADQAPAAVRSILLDYEPNFDPAFTWEFPPTLAHLDQFSARCRGRGRRAIAYPTGRAIQEGPLQHFGWDYAEIAGHVDDVYPQTQHWASLGAASWASALSKLRAQHSRRGIDPRSLVVQLTIGDGGNAILADPAVNRFREARDLGIRRLFVWWSPPFLDELSRFLTRLDQ
ncbi:MAG: hypothetical protein L3K03_07265 [Thermoplasmata archaeon]|nr:hypothetical protein [Thermoplasmata archaeon]